MVDLPRPRHVRNVNHSVNSLLQLDERAVGSNIPNLAMNMGAHWIIVNHHIPWIRIQLANAKRDFLFVLLNSKNYCFNIVSHL